MELIKINFKDCDRLLLEETFGLIQNDEINIMSNWIENTYNCIIDDYENITIKKLLPVLKYRVDDWNEQELIEHFISPIFSLIGFNTLEYGMFSERLLKAVINDYELLGYPDAIVAKGRRVPKIPYFCFYEYKKEEENKGDAKGQCLAAMMVAQELNNNTKPIFGVVVKGVNWYFMVLQGKEYAISKPYKAVDDELIEIVKLLKHLKSIIEIYVKS